MKQTTLLLLCALVLTIHVPPCYAALLQKTLPAAICTHDATDTPVANGRTAHHGLLDRLEMLRHKNDDQQDAVNIPGQKRSGIWGRLSLYFGLVSVGSLIATLAILSTAYSGAPAVLWAWSAILAVVAGLIGLRRKKKRGMAIAGLLLGLSQLALLGLLIALGSAVVSGAPFFAFLLLLGR